MKARNACPWRVRLSEGLGRRSVGRWQRVDAERPVAFDGLRVIVIARITCGEDMEEARVRELFASVSGEHDHRIAFLDRGHDVRIDYLDSEGKYLFYAQCSRHHTGETLNTLRVFLGRLIIQARRGRRRNELREAKSFERVTRDCSAD